MRLFPGLVAIAQAKHPVPSRTRPLSAVAPMVLRLKAWESRSPPNLEKTNPYTTISNYKALSRKTGLNCMSDIVVHWTSRGKTTEL